MADPTRRQIAMMADEVGITDHAAACKLVRRAFEVSRSARAAIEADGPIDDLIPSKYRGWEITVYRDGAQAGYRAAIARWGPQPDPPAAGEVGQLVAKLRRLAPQNPLGSADPTLTRAADLLAQRYPQPVPVAGRLPGPGDCDELGRCWLFSKVEKEWRLIDAGNPGVPHLKYCFSHWLPFHALPLPAGEVGHG